MRGHKIVSHVISEEWRGNLTTQECYCFAKRTYLKEGDPSSETQEGKMLTNTLQSARTQVFSISRNPDQDWSTTVIRCTNHDRDNDMNNSGKAGTSSQVGRSTTMYAPKSKSTSKGCKK